MPTFEILVSRANLEVSNSTMEIKAVTQEEAEKKAIQLAPYEDSWKESGDDDFHYQIEESEVIDSS